ncbi:mechanosensitive ion channel family protein [Thiorhodovibrio frisius]|uniref:Small-conductance mechanosensitive channel n=1 Tax=Thiorhodovibrio frisius TaxID=631362 RepID=H8Z522_9GAMM|nr:mechanosensitive ion channel family protein [Thiorhodovibrio frisius]EIC20429.1 small-conductance mechanosensitive channel [Thiorhodovibrio frisius]WPL21172.1 MscS family inner membrane protein YnaI [Thiorhodovibrio frisius]
MSKFLPLALILAVLFLSMDAAWAEAAASAESAETPDKVTEPSPPQGLGNPRATWSTLQTAIQEIQQGQEEEIETVISTLDLSEINLLVRKERGKDLAWQLIDLLGLLPDPPSAEKLSDAPDSEPVIIYQTEAGRIRLSRSAGNAWLFDPTTLEQIPPLRDELDQIAEAVPPASESQPVSQALAPKPDRSHLPWQIRFRHSLPAPMRHTSFVLENWIWLALLGLILLGLVMDKLASLLLRSLVRIGKRRTAFAEIKSVSDDILRPWGLMAMALVWWAGINLLSLPEGALLVLLVAVKFLASLSGVWAAFRLVDVTGAYLSYRAALTETKLDDALVPLVPRTLKIFVAVIGLVFIADNLKIDVSSLLAGLGLGGLAFALAAKDMVQNLFGSLTVLLDRTFLVGDWILVGEIEGTVESIGFRSTRIRTFYNSLVTVPNSRFITAEVDNMGLRRYRRYSTKLGITYDTPPERIEAFCEGLRELVRQHPYMRKDYFHIYLNHFGNSSLEVLVYVFWQTPDWSTELRERHRFLLDVLRVGKELGVEFAFPTQTLYLKSSDQNAPLPELELSAAEQRGRDAAREIVTKTTGLGAKPSPVVIG